MTKRRILAGAVLVAGVVAVWTVLPPASRRLHPPVDPLLVRGAVHIHTTRSDGAGTPDDVARAASAAGLAFIVLTDHGDGQRRPDPPRYAAGVLVIDGVEISTGSGHYVAIGIRQAPYRLAGDARDVIEDVRRLGGFGIAAHPDSPKPALRWRTWSPAPDGLEWLNADSEWRDESRATLTRAFITYWIRGPESLAGTFDRPSETLARWDRLTQQNRVVGLLAPDAHARLPLDPGAEPGEGPSLGVPSYATAFRTMSIGVRLDAPMVRREEAAQADADHILAALRAGHVFSSIDALAGPAVLDFSAQASAGRAVMGEDLVGDGDVGLTASLQPAVAGASIVMIRNGADRAISDAPVIHVTHRAIEGDAVYRVEVRLPDAPGTPAVPWMVSNPIYVRRAARTAPSALLHQTVATLAGLRVARAWGIERQPASDATVSPGVAPDGSRASRFTWRIASGAPAGQYAALALSLRQSEFAGADAIGLDLQAPRPMRLSVQLRIPGGAGHRWERSVYVDRTPRTIVVPFREMLPIEAPGGTALDPSRVDTLLLVVDTVNTMPGSAGECWVGRVTAERLGGATSAP